MKSGVSNSISLLHHNDEHHKSNDDDDDGLFEADATTLGDGDEDKR